MDLVAVKTQLRIAKTQFDRSTALNKEGLKPLTDVEQKRLKLQESEAYIITQQNKLLSSKNELINAKVEINRITAEYTEKISKSKSDKFTALSTQYDTEAQVNKLENQYKKAAEKTETKDFASMEKVWSRVEEKLDAKEDKKTIVKRFKISEKLKNWEIPLT